MGSNPARWQAYRWASAAALICLAGAACEEGPSRDFAGDIEPFFLKPATPLPEVEFQRRGKILALDAVTRRLDPMHDRLPDAIRARRPEEVGTVALVNCVVEKTWQYGYIFASAYAHSCQVHLIDSRSRAFLANFGDANPPPRRVWLPFWPRTASRPTPALVQFTQQLPDRGASR